MKSSLQKRVLSPSLFFLAVGALIHCGGDDNDRTSFSTQGDTAVMAGIVGTWMGTSAQGNTYTLTLCEDANAGAITNLSCQTLHVVKGNGRGKTETVTDPEGCGGCDYDNSAYVKGTIEGDDLQSSDVHGQFGLNGGDTNSLGFPYQISIGFVDTSSSFVSLTGSMPSSGAFTADDFDYSPTAAPGVDASTIDSGNDDASDVDASESDSASTFSAPVPTAGNGSTQVDVTSGITFHRVGDAACP